MLQFIHNMGKNSALWANFCYVQFAMLYLQNHSLMLKIICGIGKIICGIGWYTFSPLLLGYFRHDISVGSNFYKVPYELNIHGADLHKRIL